MGPSGWDTGRPLGATHGPLGISIGPSIPIELRPRPLRVGAVATGKPVRPPFVSAARTGGGLSGQAPKDDNAPVDHSLGREPPSQDTHQIFKMAETTMNQPRHARQPIWGLVLSGGRSRRMGRDKALLEQDGRTALDRAVALLARHLERVFVSVRPDQATDAVRARYDQIVDRYENIGPAAGILSALEAYPNVAWLVLACDLPNVEDATLTSLLNSRSQRPFTAFRSSRDGLPEPLCAIYRPAARPLVAGFVGEGVVCPRKMLIRSDSELLELPFPDSLENVNTPEDLERLRSNAL